MDLLSGKFMAVYVLKLALWTSRICICGSGKVGVAKRAFPRLFEGLSHCGFSNMLSGLGDDELKPSPAAMAYKGKKAAGFLRPIISHDNSPMIYG
ncbi:hypothetical protein CHELA1G11_11284 [Hyphomicrobiales bacterium]|nr:hypothetical protein CHELA1G11_11284 [Hyphomicrobiales bacterium]CAH1668842.1 hypothetical protein CHELA1G2_13025 [Hyphomicrobiales bacterium]